VKAAGCEGAGFDDLRRANATRLVRDGVDIRTAQSLLRHSDARLTLNVYAQAEAEAQRQAVDRMGSAFLGSRDKRGMDSPGTERLGGLHTP
jgi:integrase